MSETNDDGCVSPDCFRAYVSAEIKVPNTLIAVGPYVGHAALASLLPGDDLKPAIQRFANTFAFSPGQTKNAIKTVVLIHRRFGVPVLPEGADLRGDSAIRVFKHQRFEVVYMEGVMNILESILRLHGERGEKGSPRGSRVAELLEHPDKRAATVAALAAAENAIDSPAATERSEAFKQKFNFVKSGEKPRPMAPADKDGIQAEVVPLIVAAVTQALSEFNWNLSRDQADEFVRVLTSPELHDEAA
ncbi:hypothetical protein [Mycobacterium sp. MMS18-G62]